MSICGKLCIPASGWVWISRQASGKGASVMMKHTGTFRTLCANLKPETSSDPIAPVDLAFKLPPRLRDKTPDPNGKPPVVILHGMLGSASNWRSVLSRSDFFAGPQDYVCALDLRNHGLSQHAPTMSYEEMCIDVDQFSRKWGVQKAHLIGHSMGGKVAMTLALMYPERVASLCVVDIAPVDYAKSSMHVTLMDAMLKLDLTHINQVAEARKALKAGIPDPMVREFVLTNLVSYKNSEGQSKLKWKVNLEVLRHGVVKGDLTKFPMGSSSIYDGPTLFVRGGRSDYIKEEYYLNMAEMFPNFEVKTIEGASHWVHHEKQEEFLEILKNWYATHY